MQKIAILIAGGIILHWALSNLTFLIDILRIIWGLFFPFILGLMIAFLINIPMRFVEKLLFKDKHPKVKRGISFIVTLILVLSVVGLVGFLVVPQLVSTISMLGASMPGYLNIFNKTTKPYLDQLPQLQAFIEQLNLNWNNIGTQLFHLLGSGAGNIFSSTMGVATSIVSGTTSVVIGFIFACYILLDKEHLTKQTEGLLRAYVPEIKYNKFMELARLANHIFSRFVSGQVTESVAVCTVFLIALTIGRFDYPLLISVLIGFLSLIPIFGSFIGCLIGTFLILVSSGIWRALAFLILFLILQQLDGNFMYPRIVGNSVGLPPIWVLVAVTLGAGLMGIFGMLFFIPLASFIYTLIRKDALIKLEAKGIASPVTEWRIVNHNQHNKKKKNTKLDDK